MLLRSTREEVQDDVITSDVISRSEDYRQFETVGSDSAETVKDSIHLDWVTLNGGRMDAALCPECGCVVRLWDTFAHRLLFNKTFHQSVAFQPLSARYETERWDSPIEGFVFRLWTWLDPPTDTFTAGRHRITNPTEPP